MAKLINSVSDINSNLIVDMQEFLNTQKDVVSLLNSIKNGQIIPLSMLTTRINAQTALSLNDQNAKSGKDWESVPYAYPLKLNANNVPVTNNGKYSSFCLGQESDNFVLKFPLKPSITSNYFPFDQKEVCNYGQIKQQFENLGLVVLEGNYKKYFDASANVASSIATGLKNATSKLTSNQKNYTKLNYTLKIDNQVGNHLVSEQEKIAITLDFIAGKYIDKIVSNLSKTQKQKFNNCEYAIMRLYANILICRALNWGDSFSCKNVEMCLINQLSMALNSEFDYSKTKLMAQIASKVAEVYLKTAQISTDMVQQNLADNGYVLNADADTNNVVSMLTNVTFGAEMHKLNSLLNSNQVYADNLEL